MPSLKVVALISGGKDSLYSILHCLAHEHVVVALANLHPPLHNSQVEEDIDSFMYQTIGHRIVPLYEQALGLPLYRQEIVGDAVNMDKTYAHAGITDKQDETESLLLLLQRVLAVHPEINAVSSGAILSDYQRTRVESVAARLGLTSLAYLWQYPRIVTHSPTALLEDMSAAGQEARIIKVSGGGLDTTFLWEDVTKSQVSARLLRSSQQFGDVDNGSVLGEGGEYETLATSGPSPLWKGRIAVREEDIQHIKGEAGSASARIIDAHVSPMLEPSDPFESVRQPSIFEEPFSALFGISQEAYIDAAVAAPAVGQDDMSTAVDISGMVRDHMLCGVTGAGKTAAEQIEAIMITIQARLDEAGLTINDIAYTSIVLRSMSDFATVNAAYAKPFMRPNPPARMTLAYAAMLPSESKVSVSVTSRKLADPRQRQGLHVQSVSYWAPANIGPYSQAITLPAGRDDTSASIVYVAGQIPLVPASMELYRPETGDDFLGQAILSLQHLHRIRIATSVQHWLSAVAFITAPSHTEAVRRAANVRRLWRSMHHNDEQETVDDGDDYDEEFDVWHQRYGHQQGSTWQHDSAHGLASCYWQGRDPSLSVFLVDALPRNASIEWVAFGTTSPTASGLVTMHHRHILDIFANQAL